MYVVVCTDLLCKDPHRQVGVGRVVKSISTGGVMFITSLNARDMGSIPVLDAIFPIFITSRIYIYICSRLPVYS